MKATAKIGYIKKSYEVPAGAWTKISVLAYANQGATVDFCLLTTDSGYLLVDDVCLKKADRPMDLNWLAGNDAWVKRGLFNCIGKTNNSAHVRSGSSPWQIGGFSEEPYGIYQDYTLRMTGNYEFSFYVNSFGEHMNIAIEAGDWRESYEISDSQWHKVSVVFSGRQGDTVTLFLHLEDGHLFYADDGELHLTDKQPKPLPVNPNLLRNPSFENTLDSWTNQGSASAFASTSTAYTGSQSVMLGYFTSEPLERYIEQDCPVSRVGAYQFSAYIKTDASLSGVGAVLFLEARDKNGSVLASNISTAVPSTGGKWQRAAVSLNAPAGTASIAVKIGGIYCTDAFFADDASLVLL